MNKRNNLYIYNMATALLIQVGNFEIFKKLECYIYNFDENCIIMIHLNEILNQNDIINIKNRHPNAIYTFGENKGMDIFGFFVQIKYIIDNDLNIDYICKIHTKTNDNWRDNLIKPLCETKEDIINCINLLKNDNNGMVCSKKYFKLLDHLNGPIIINLLNHWKIKNKYIDEIDWKEKEENLYDLDKFDPHFYITYPYNNIMYDENHLKDINKINSYGLFHWLEIGFKHFKYVHYPELIKFKNEKHYKYCAGTIFWIRANILINFFKKYINFDEFCRLFENDYFDNSKPTFTHSWERLFSIIIYYNKKIIINI